MTISILGCGWYGKALGIELVKRGISIKGSTTSDEKISLLENEGITPYFIELSPEKKIINDDFFSCDILWISIPPKARAGKGLEYLAQLELLVVLIKQHRIGQVILISSTGVYRDDNRTVNEMDEPYPDSEAGRILLAAEELLKQQTDFTTTIIRFGGLTGPARDPGRFFAGKTDIPNGDAPVNLIHLTDCIGISLALLKKQAFGYTYNAVSPEHPTRSDFYTAATKRSGLTAPQFIAEKNNWKIVGSINVPAQLQYTFKVSLNE